MIFFSRLSHPWAIHIIALPIVQGSAYLQPAESSIVDLCCTRPHSLQQSPFCVVIGKTDRSGSLQHNADVKYREHHCNGIKARSPSQARAGISLTSSVDSYHLRPSKSYF